jgi:hypothetical protein
MPCLRSSLHPFNITVIVTHLQSPSCYTPPSWASADPERAEAEEKSVGNMFVPGM